ncbi:MAG: diacylglycerol kinase family protein [Micropepsaceae bacterium]
MTSFSIKARLKSLSHAIDGIAALVSSQHNARIHVAATIAVVALGLVLGLAAWEWCSVILAVSIVWTSEALNTGFEFVCDVVSPEINPKIKIAKDIAAAGVLLASCGAAIVGAIVFLPHILAILGI